MRGKMIGKGFEGRKLFLLFLLLAGILLCGGCFMVGPDYSPPETAAPETWHTPLAGGLETGKIDPVKLASWWRALDDSLLEKLETQAMAGNHDLRIARSRIREARARWGITRAGLFPRLDARGSFKEYRQSEEYYGTGDKERLYRAGFDAGWELDIFGGTRRAMEAAEAEVAATRENLNDVLITLQAEVAFNYLLLRTDQARLKAARGNIKTQQETCNLNRSLYEAGLIDKLALEQSLFNLEHTRSRVPALETGIERSCNRLAVLLGVAPGTLQAELTPYRTIPDLPAELAVGIPAETLRRRPDIRRAERNLAAATARIGQATADLYPRFHLVGTIGLESLSYDKLWRWASRSWGYGPGISWNIFDAGAIRRNIEVQTELQKQALAAYEKTLLLAREEVENAIVAYAREQQRRQYLTAAVASADEAIRLARDQFQAGLVDFNNVLITQLSLLALQDELAQSNGLAAANLVRLYKALGGGWNWQPPADRAKAAAAPAPTPAADKSGNRS